MNLEDGNEGILIKLVSYLNTSLGDVKVSNEKKGPWLLFRVYRG